MATVTTVGYGDVTPESVGGKMIAVGLMLVGIGFVALFTAFIADRFIRSEEHEDRHDQVIAKLESIEQRLESLEERG
jgi:voltage-gated potassium channel